MATILHDVRCAVRLLSHQRGFSLLASVTFALGVGALTTLVSVIDATILRPVPYPDPDRLVNVRIDVPRRKGGRVEVGPSEEDRRRWSASARSVLLVASWQTLSGPFAPLVDGPQLERLSAMQVSGDYFTLYRVSPVLGRPIANIDTRAGAPRVVMVSHRFWNERLGGRRSALGRTIRHDGDSSVIIGVVPAAFFPNISLWLPWRPGVFDAMRGTGATVHARLHAGVSPEAAAHELAAIAGAGAAKTDLRVVARPLLDEAGAHASTSVVLVTASVVLILLIACVNLGGLVLARGKARLTELTVRASLGASPFTLMRQLVIENLMLCALGGAAGIAASWLSLGSLVTLLPIAFPPNSATRLDMYVLGSSIGIATLSSIVFSVMPALILTRAGSGVDALKCERHAVGSLSRRSARVLIGAEVALAVVLMVSAGLMIRSFQQLGAVELGFVPEGFVTMDVTPVRSDVAVHDVYYSALLESLRAIPGVKAAGAADQVPLVGASSSTNIVTPGGDDVSVSLRQVSPRYFEAMGMAFVSGRDLRDADRAAGAISATVLCQTAARRLFPGESALGQRITLGNQTLVVVGVVGDVRHWGPLRQTTYPEIYIPYRSTGVVPEQRNTSLTVVVRFESNGSVSAERLREVAMSLGPRVVVGPVRSGRDSYFETIALPRQRLVLMSLLGGLAVLMVLVGVVGITSYSAARRAQEVGARLALGATTRQVVRMIVLDSVLPALTGTIVGLAIAAVSTRMIAVFLFDTSPTDATTFTVVPLVLFLSVTVAAWLAARQTAFVNPADLLRNQ